MFYFAIVMVILNAIFAVGHYQVYKERKKNFGLMILSIVAATACFMAAIGLSNG